jgi:hypothetical protein
MARSILREVLAFPRRISGKSTSVWPLLFVGALLYVEGVRAVWVQGSGNLKHVFVYVAPLLVRAGKSFSLKPPASLLKTFYGHHRVGLLWWCLPLGFRRPASGNQVAVAKCGLGFIVSEFC